MSLSKQTIYYSKMVEDSKNCQRSLFKIVNELLDKKNRENILLSHTDPKQLADDFNSYYIQKVMKILQSINEYGVKTSMEDPIPSKVLQSYIDIFVPLFVKLINKSFVEGNMDGVKGSVIDPLLKKAGLDRDNKKNHRPVNKLLFFRKLIERVVLSRLDQHMTANCIHDTTHLV